MCDTCTTAIRPGGPSRYRFWERAMRRPVCWAAIAALWAAPLAFGQYDGLVINEILPSPTNAAGIYVDANEDGEFNSFDDEFIELLNTSTNPIDVDGLWLTDTYTNIQRHVFSPRILPPGGSIVVFGGGSLLNFSNPPAQIATGGGLSLNNDAETVSLFSSPTTLVDQVSYQVPASHNAISTVRNPDGTGTFTNHYLITTNTARASPGQQTHGLPFLTNHPPVLLDLADQTAFVGIELQFPVRAYDPADRDVIALAVSGHPTNSSLVSTGGVGTFTFTAALDQVGNIYDVSFTAADTNGAETNTISMRVVNPNAEEDIWINEIHYDNDGIDSDEGVEIAGTANTVLSEYSLILYNGLNGTLYNSNALTGTLDDEDCGFGAAWFGFSQLQNETEGIALVKGTNVIQFLSYEGVLTATDGPAAGMTSIDIGVHETAVTVGYSLQLEGTGTAYSDFNWTNAQPHSRGLLNSNQTVECLAPASIEIQKTVYLGHDSGVSAPGDESVQGTNGAPVTYVFIVSNTGGTTLTNVTVTDVSLGIPPIDLGTMATGMVSTSYVEAVLSGDLRNTATVSGYDPDEVLVSDDDTAEVVEIILSLAIQKTVYRGHDAGASCPGSDYLQATNSTPVTYCFLVENNGSTNLNSLTLTDDDLGIGPIGIGTLEAGGTFATSVEAVVTGSLTNTATVAGVDPNSDPVSNQDTAVVDMISPAILLQKSVYLGHDGGVSCPGSEQVAGTNGAAVTYCFQVSNAGDTTLTNVVLNDADLPGFAATNLGPLATGEIASVFIERYISGDLINAATVSGYGPDGGPVSDEDTAAVEEFNPGISIQKTVYSGHDGGASCPGSDVLQTTNGAPVTYCFEVENTGDTNLTAVTIGDDDLGIAPIVVGTLEAGGTFSTSVEAVVTGSLTNTATVNGLDPNSDPVSDQDTAEVEVGNPSILLQKSVYLGHDGGASCPGAEQVSGTNGTAITFCFQVSNTGDSTLTNVVLSDAALPGFPDTGLGSLTNGESASVYFETAIDSSRLNTATVTAYTVLSVLISAEDSASVIEVPATNMWGGGEYEVIDLGTLGGDASAALGINDRSQAVGWSRDSNGLTQAFLWESDVISGLGFLPGGSNSVASAINNHGIITGNAHVSPTNWNAFSYSNASMSSLGAPVGPYSSGLGISDYGYIVGSTSQSNSTSNQSFFWKDGTFSCIPPYHTTTWPSCDALGINEDGWVCGITAVYASDSRWWAYVWFDANGNGADDEGEMHLLGSLGVLNSFGSQSGALAINDFGQVVGWSSITNTWTPHHAFLLTPSNGQWKIPAGLPNPTNVLMQDLGTLESPDQNSYANGINNRTWIVGQSTTSSGTNQAFLWRNGTMVNLNDLIATNTGWVLTNATAINNNNEIVGSGIYEGQQRAFMLRQEGRITDVVPVISTSTQVMTNEFSEVITQEVEYVETQVIHWAGLWGANPSTPKTFTVEYCDALRQQWLPYAPTSQWPISGNVWTNTDFSTISMRFFRVRAQEW